MLLKFLYLKKYWFLWFCNWVLKLFVTSNTSSLKDTFSINNLLSNPKIYYKILKLNNNILENNSSCWFKTKNLIKKGGQIIIVINKKWYSLSFEG